MESGISVHYYPLIFANPEYLPYLYTQEYTYKSFNTNLHEENVEIGVYDARNGLHDIVRY